MKDTFHRLNQRFIDMADWVSGAMGTPVNIVIWILLVIGWFAIFATHPDLAKANFMPAWFTSNSFNFPLNTVTTLAELYIGFLVAAAANRVEKRNRQLQEENAAMLARDTKLLERVEHIIKRFEDHETTTIEKQNEELAAQTTLLKEIHQLICIEEKIASERKRKPQRGANRGARVDTPQ